MARSTEQRKSPQVDPWDAAMAASFDGCARIAEKYALRLDERGEAFAAAAARSRARRARAAARRMRESGSP